MKQKCVAAIFFVLTVNENNCLDKSCENMLTFAGDGRLTDNNLADDSTNSHPVEVTVRPKEMSARTVNTGTSCIGSIMPIG